MVKVTVENNDKVNVLGGDFTLGAVCTEKSGGDVEAGMFLMGVINKEEFPHILADIVISILKNATEEDDHTCTAAMILMLEMEIRKRSSAYMEELAGGMENE